MTDIISEQGMLERKAWSSICKAIDWEKFWSTPIKRGKVFYGGQKVVIDPPVWALERMMENYFPYSLHSDPEKILSTYEWMTGNTDIFRPAYAKA